MIIFMGLKYLNSGEDPDARSMAKNGIIAAFAGIIIIAITVPVVNFIGEGFLGMVDCGYLPDLKSGSQPITPQTGDPGKSEDADSGGMTITGGEMSDAASKELSSAANGKKADQETEKPPAIVGNVIRKESSITWQIANTGKKDLHDLTVITTISGTDHVVCTGKTEPGTVLYAGGSIPIECFVDLPDETKNSLEELGKTGNKQILLHAYVNSKEKTRAETEKMFYLAELGVKTERPEVSETKKMCNDLKGECRNDDPRIPKISGSADCPDRCYEIRLKIMSADEPKAVLEAGLEGKPKGSEVTARVGETVFFDVSKSKRDESWSQYRWTLDYSHGENTYSDSGLSADQLKHVYTAPGDYKVVLSLTALSADCFGGICDYDSHPVTVHVQPDGPVTAVLSVFLGLKEVEAQDRVFSVGDSLSFSSEKSYPNSGASLVSRVLSFSDLPDKQVLDGSSEIFSRNYNAPGRYSVRLDVTDSLAYYSTDEVRFSVEDTNKQLSEPSTGSENVNTPKGAFIISDENWKDVLELVPIAVSDVVHPLLVFSPQDAGIPRYYNGGGSRITVIADFLKMYKPEKVVFFGEAPQSLSDAVAQQTGLKEGQLILSSPDRFLDYWKNADGSDSYSSVVYSEDSYETALFASVYASYLKEPLIIKGSGRDTDSSFTGKNVICVGTPGRTCTSTYTLKGLRDEYIRQTGTDKMILVNPGDLSTYPYGETSLLAPVLAAAKKEVIISTSADVTAADKAVKQEIDWIYDELGVRIKFLTIMAGFSAIPHAEEYGGSCATSFDWQYANIDDDPFVDVAVGRIATPTISGLSGYVGRDIFYDRVKLAKENIAMDDSILSCDNSDIYSFFPLIASKFDDYYAKCGSESLVCGASTSTCKEIVGGSGGNNVKDKTYYYMHRHSTSDGSGPVSTEAIKEYISNTIIHAESCLTCIADYTLEISPICLYALEQGAIAYIGSTDTIGYQIPLSGVFYRMHSTDEEFGEIIRQEVNFIFTREINRCRDYILIGDPTIKYGFPLKFEKFDNDARLVEEGHDRIVYEANLKTSVPGEISCHVYIDTHKQLWEGADTAPWSIESPGCLEKTLTQETAHGAYLEVDHDLSGDKILIYLFYGNKLKGVDMPQLNPTCDGKDVPLKITLGVGGG